MRDFYSFHNPMDGYGLAGLKTLGALERGSPGEWRGVDLLEGEGAATRVARTDAEGVGFCAPIYWGGLGARVLWGFTMGETTRPAEGWVGLMNRHATGGVLTTCEWCAEVYREAGVKREIFVAPLGVDPGDWPLLERGDHEGRPYTFYWSGTPDGRKGWDLVYRAFRAAFGGRGDARLRMHFREMPRWLRGCRDANVSIVQGRLDLATVVRELGEADCFVFPSRGEGWGLPPREAAATGLPVIATNWGGLAVDIDNWALPLCVGGMVEAEYGRWNVGEVGEWAEPDFDHLVSMMQWCFYCREQAARFGAQAAEWLGMHGGWDRTAAGILNAMGVGRAQGAPQRARQRVGAPRAGQYIGMGS